MYAAIDRNPENGCEIQDAVYGKSGIIMKIKLVKTAVEEEAIGHCVNAHGTLHGTKSINLCTHK